MKAARAARFIFGFLLFPRVAWRLLLRRDDIAYLWRDVISF